MNEAQSNIDNWKIGRVFSTHQSAYLRYFGIYPDQIKRLGLQKIKKRAKTKFRWLVFQIHPDISQKKLIWDYGAGLGVPKRFGSRKPLSNKADFARIKRLYDKIQDLKCLPLNYLDPEFERILDYERGYRTCQDIDFGLNNHLAEIHGQQYTW